jgi:deazaflavin-dependent oxidoreductase (nitroreductase family)
MQPSLTDTHITSSPTSFATFFTYHRDMVSGLSESQRLRVDKPKACRTPLGGILRRLNARVESRVRSGFASPGLLPAGLIVLETTGRRSGQEYRTPLLATMAPGGFLWISTVLGRRANWLRNAHADPDVCYWLGARAREGRALVSAPGYAMPDLDELPPSLRWTASRALKLSRVLGFGVVIIVPKAVDGHPSA